jgi:hypothetical protein
MGRGRHAIALVLRRWMVQLKTVSLSTVLVSAAGSPPPRIKSEFWDWEKRRRAWWFSTYARVPNTTLSADSVGIPCSFPIRITFSPKKCDVIHLRICCLESDSLNSLIVCLARPQNLLILGRNCGFPGSLEKYSFPRNTSKKSFGINTTGFPRVSISQDCARRRCHSLLNSRLHGI